jgi:signal peptidase II
MSKKNIAILTVVLAILFDQISKIYVKTHFYLGEDFVIFSDWFKFHFT